MNNPTGYHKETISARPQTVVSSAGDVHKMWYVHSYSEYATFSEQVYAEWDGQELNLRPLALQASALPG